MKLPHVKVLPAIIAFVVTMAFWFIIPPPESVDINAWRLLGIFIGTIVAIIGKALPIGGAAIIGILCVGISQVTNPGNPGKAMADALSGFSNTLIWLIGIAFFISRGFIKTGLGARVAYYFVRVFGKKTLGISYGLSLAELVLSPVMPSNTARGGGVMYPINRSISESMGSFPDEASRLKLGAFLTLVAYQINIITSAMFITATAPNPLVTSGIKDISGVTVSWADWAIAAFVPGVLAILIIPWVLFKLYPPEIKSTPNASQFAREKLAAMGPLKLDEWIMVGVFALLLALWAGVPSLISSDPLFAIDPTAAAFVGLGVLLFSGVLTWDDLLKEKGAWDTVTWFASLVMMATFLNKLGVITWFSTEIQGTIKDMGLGWVEASVILVLIYVYIHYFFASNTAHISALFASFFGVGVALGAPPLMFGLFLGFASSLCASITHYGTGSAPVLFGAGYVTMGEWWKWGLVTSVVNLMVWAVGCAVWWKILGYW
ncbi:C4-dicarboxylate ABC transporter [Bdellovibrio bacteriovorus]|uniref:C4-dicarboxylate ABC transporter n=1 Tax=Bdellovibrio bacteriovorus TaxID=959 RepID=A0A150WQZ4_BDEBC|nr:DASS family sodium-coupled anion symporter [Bdellovibrio bacteriovorus]KYG66796.1 C4-dicarboxylate ABC transporter [Bdellovibrio bacteriovorus]